MSAGSCGLLYSDTLVLDDNRGSRMITLGLLSILNDERTMGHGYPLQQING